MSKPSLEEIKQDMEQKRRAAAAAAAYVAYDDAATYADAIAAADVYYECCDEHEVSYMGACGMCLTEEINEMIADPKAISLVDKDFLKAVLSFIPAPTTSSDASELAKDDLLKNIESALEFGNESQCFISTSTLCQAQNEIVDLRYLLSTLPSTERVSVSDHGELVSWLRREAQFWRLANPAAKRGEALDSARCEDRANKIDEAATAIRNIQKPSEFYCQKCGGMLNEFSKCGKCLSTKPDTSNASDLASVPLLDWLDDGDRGEKGFTGYNLKFDEAFRIKDALSALPSTATSSEYQGVKIVEDPTLKDDEFKMVATSSDEPKP